MTKEYTKGLGGWRKGYSREERLPIEECWNIMTILLVPEEGF